LGNNSTLSLSTSAASVGGTLSVSGNATFDTNVYVGGVVANVDDLDTNISFGTNQISLITGGLTRLSASDASVQVTNPLIASSTLTVTGNYNSIFGDIALSNGKIAVGGSVSIANSVGASLFSPNANLLVIGDTGAASNQGMTIVSPTGATGNIYFADGTTGDAEYRGSITYNHNVDTLYIGAAATNKLAISGTQSTFSGNVLVVGNLPSYTNSLYVDSTTNNVGIGTNNPQNSSGYAGLHLNGATGGVVKFMDDATVVSQVFGNNNEVTIQAEGERDVVVKTNNSERLRIEDAGASVTGTLSVSGGITGTLSTASQTNITSVGTLSSLAVSGTSVLTGNVGVGVTPSSWNANSKAIQLPQYVSLSQQNNASLNLMSFALESSGNTFTYADTGVYPLRYNQNPNDGSHSWYSAGSGTAGNTISFSEKMRIDSSGNITVGTASDTGAKSLFLINDSNTTGSGIAQARNAGQYVSTSAAGDMIIGSATGKDIIFGDIQAETTYARIDADGLKFNTDTAAANALDDYEEGTWTPALKFSGVDTGITYSQRGGNYTKIGRKVSVTCYANLSSKGAITGGAIIDGLPFSVASGISNYSAATIWFYNVSFANQFIGYAVTGNPYVNLQEIRESGTVLSLLDTNFADNSEFMVSLTYFTT
jgi:hypothetical protein